MMAAAPHSESLVLVKSSCKFEDYILRVLEGGVC